MHAREIKGVVMNNPRNPLKREDAQQRYQALQAWVLQQLAEQWPDTPISESNLQPLNSDAGFRVYYRLQDEELTRYSRKLLAVDAPPATEDTGQFVALAQYLRRYGVRTPMVFAADRKRGFLLVEDFGDALLQDTLQSDSATALYGEALLTLLTLQQAPDNPLLIPRYDQALLRRELDIFRDWFVQHLLEYSLDAAEQVMLELLFSQLEASALEQPQVLVHRDYHSRNLLLCESGAMGVIDFQGALWGPCTYDVVSLLRDCYLRWPAADVQRWALGYGNMAMDCGILPEVDAKTYLRWFDWMGLQRHIKVLGIFARLSLRDEKQGYLTDLSRVMGYVLEVADSYPEFADFAQWFRARLLPLAEQQAWYKPGDLSGGQPL
jgi:hypothetical protein